MFTHCIILCLLLTAVKQTSWNLRSDGGVSGLVSHWRHCGLPCQSGPNNHLLRLLRPYITLWDSWDIYPCFTFLVYSAVKLLLHSQLFCLVVNPAVPLISVSKWCVLVLNPMYFLCVLLHNISVVVIKQLSWVQKNYIHCVSKKTPPTFLAVTWTNIFWFQ